MFTPNGAISATPSAVYTDSGSFVEIGGTVTMAGAFTHTSALGAGTPVVLGTIGAIPTSNRVMASWILNTSTGASSTILLTVNTVGQVTMTSVTGLAAPATTYTVFLSGNTYAL